MRPDCTLDVDTDLLNKAAVTPIDASFGLVKAIESKTVPVREMIAQELKTSMADVLVVFAVRYVGCSSCREHAVQIAELANAVRGVVPIAVVKETGVNDQALQSFHQDYFERNPMYKDARWKVYSSMGGRRLSWFTVIRRLMPSQKRWKKKQIVSQSADGDFWTQGGMLVLGKDAELIHAAHDEFGIEFNMSAAKEAIRSYRS